MSIPVTLREPNALSSYSVNTVSSSSNSSVGSSRSGSHTKSRPMLPEIASLPAAIGGSKYFDALPDEIKPIYRIDKPDLRLLLMISFPMKLHLMLEKCGWEPPKRRKRKRSNNGVNSSNSVTNGRRLEYGSHTDRYSTPGKRQKTVEEQRDTDSCSTLGTEISNDATSKTHAFKPDNKDVDSRNDTTAIKTPSTSTKTDVDARDTKTDDAKKTPKNMIIGWVSNGTAFKIYDEELFVREIMPHYHLGHTPGCRQQDKSFQDFQRNLDMWGFTDMQCVEGPPMRRIHICSHPSFVRGQTNACRKMRFRPRRP